MTHHLDLEQIVLSAGSHSSPDEGACLLEVVSMFAQEPFSDAPQCVCPTLRAFGMSWNDGMRTDEERAQLKPYIPALVGTAGSVDDSSRRAWMALDWSVRVSTPAWLDLAGLADHAQRLRAFGEVTGPDDEVQEALEEARRDAAAAGAAAWDAAWDAAWAAAWAAAGAAARDAAGDAAGAAARAAAGDAARDAARAAARAAAGDAARDAAGAAARAAAGDAARDAAGAAAWASAWDAFEPTVAELQPSAHDLYCRMIAAGPHDRDALTQARTQAVASA